jgi:hypothetical protein
MVFCILISGKAVYCSDLDDGIDIDDNINSYDAIGNPEQNIKFIKMNAKSNAKRTEKLVEKGLAEEGGSGMKGGGAMNSVVMGPGSNVKGDIIIIDESKGDKTQVVD